MASFERDTNEQSGETPKSDHAPGQPSQKQTGETPSGMQGDNPGTAGPGKSDVQSKTPENAAGHLNPSAPEDANITPGSNPTK